ncbi:MAG: 4Fe-4S binding protein [Bacilli bacterium]|nr:4Fe-4S binding protein [Bacilli bacterium]
MARGILYFRNEDCKGCGLCVEFCPTKILELDLNKMNEKGYNLIKIIDLERCIACGFCALMCPDSVIDVERQK